MKIQYCSDLHLEFVENKEFLIKNPITKKADILILAGDIVPFVALKNHNDFFDYLSDNYEYTYWVPGNHEFYYSDIALNEGILNKKIRSNVYLVNNTSVDIKNAKLIFSTLWSKISHNNQWIIQQSLSDFHIIKDNTKLFTPDKYNFLHSESKSFIERELKHNMQEKTIVVTHHVPTFMNYPEIYKGDALSQAFATELFDLIEKSNIDYWIFGHHHKNISDFRIGKTLLATNQLGYVKYGEHLSFNRFEIIDTNK